VSEPLAHSRSLTAHEPLFRHFLGDIFLVIFGVMSITFEKKFGLLDQLTPG
jgi:hypothetical protein